MDGMGQWVAEPTVINHEMMRGELAKVVSLKHLTKRLAIIVVFGLTRSERKISIAKFYPGDFCLGKTSWSDISATNGLQGTLRCCLV